MKKKFPKLKVFIQKQLNDKKTISPTSIQEDYESQYPEAPKLTARAYQLAFKRLGLGIAERKELIQKKRALDERDIMQYQEVQSYIAQSQVSGIKQSTLDNQLSNIRAIWELMDRTYPFDIECRWNAEKLLSKIKEVVPMTTDESGKIVFSNKGKVQSWLSAVNTMFPSILTKGWSNAFNIQNLELKDYLSFDEFAAYCDNVTDSESLSREGWKALFKCQVNGAMREGASMKGGVLYLQWQNINYKTRRCKLAEKGGKGNAGRMWHNIPLDLYKWLNGWSDLMTYHAQKFGYIPTNERHETGRVFPIQYREYNQVFHETRKRTNGRIAGDKESFRPHIFRKTHANWNHKLKIPLEMTCGDYPNGFFGVGWDNINILRKYYMVIDEEDIEETQKKVDAQIAKLGLT